MKAFQQWARLVCGALLVLMFAAACGGGGGGSSDNGSGDGGDGGDGGVVDTSKTCQQQFNPDKAAAGDDCSPNVDQYCPGDDSTSLLLADSSVNECDGVTTTNGTATANGLTSNFVIIKPTSTAKATAGSDALIVALHWADTNAETMANRIRLSELAKGRNVTIVAPTAPDPVPFRTWAPSSIFSPSSSVADRMALLDQVIALAQGSAKAVSTHVILLGDSGGAAFAFQYMCQRSAVTGAMFVAPDIRPADLAACQLSHPVATFQVHGTNDFLSPYAAGSNSAGAQETFSAMFSQNGCTTAPASVSLPVPSSDAGITGLTLQYASPCGGRGSALLTVEGGGHNYPGFSSSFPLPFNIYGFYTTGFDATLQGYDLLRYLGA